MEKFFHLKENGTTVSTEILAGLTTFFAMAYIIVVNPQILSQTGMPWGGVFLATIIAAIIGTLVMGLFANVPYAQAAGVLVIVGCMMAASLKEVKWDDIAEAIPAFFAAVFMAFSYSISYGIAGGFIMYCIVKTCKGKAKEVHPIIWTVAALFILDFVCMAIL